MTGRTNGATADLFIEATWQVPSDVHALTTLRGTLAAGHGADDGFDLSHRAPPANRARLGETLALPARPLWLRQVHGVDVARAESCGDAPEADAAVTRSTGTVLAVLTADCLPVAFCHPSTGALGVAHAGWRGLAAGVLERTLDALGTPADEVHAWLGPAIGPTAFEVGAEVREAFLDVDPGAAPAFVANRPGHWLADLYELARRRLRATGVVNITGGERCTHGEQAAFFSFRRDRSSARMATLLWRDP